MPAPEQILDLDLTSPVFTALDLKHQKQHYSSFHLEVNSQFKGTQTRNACVRLQSFYSPTVFTATSVCVVELSMKQLMVLGAMAVIAGFTESVIRVVNAMEIKNKTVSLMSVC